MKSFQRAIKVFGFMMFIFIVSACSTSSSQSYTFMVENGDKIKIALDTSDSYSLKQGDGRFEVMKDDEAILQGMFLLKDVYQELLNIKDIPDVKIIEDKEKDGNVYFFYELKGQAGIENNYILWVKDSNTGIAFGSLAKEKQAKAAFERLTITLE